MSFGVSSDSSDRAAGPPIYVSGPPMAAVRPGRWQLTPRPPSLISHSPRHAEVFRSVRSCCLTLTKIGIAVGISLRSYRPIGPIQTEIYVIPYPINQSLDLYTARHKFIASYDNDTEAPGSHGQPKTRWKRCPFSDTILISSQMTKCQIILLLQPIIKLYLLTIELKLRDDFRCSRSKIKKIKKMFIEWSWDVHSAVRAAVV